MSNAAKLKKRAVELEQKKQLDKALSLYVQFLQESDGALDDGDIPLYNRVGDLMLRVGNTSDALNYYEKAVDLYADRGFLNNAIALCNKVLRQSPGRSSIYYKLGKISATKGFKSDAKKNFLEYADRMQKVGQIDEAFRALKEFADLCPDQDDIRLMLAEQLSKENRQSEALEQLQKLHDKLDSEGRTAEARATVDRMKAIDPDAVPRASGSYPPQKTSDLIFLDTSYEQGMRSRPPATPPTRQVSDPDLVVLTLAAQTDVPLTPIAPLPAEEGAEAFALDIDLPDTRGTPAAGLPLLDLEEPADSTSAPGAAAGAGVGPIALDMDALGIEPPIETVDAIAPGDVDLPATADAFSLPSDAGDLPFDAATVDDMPLAYAPGAEPVTPLDIDAEPDMAAVDQSAGPSAYVSGPPLSVDYAGDLVSEVAPDEALGGDLFDFRAPPRTDDGGMDSAPLGTLDPDVSFPAFDLGETSLPSADEITSGASLAAALGAPESLGDELADVDLSDLDAGLELPAPGTAAEILGATAERDALDVPVFDAPAVPSEIADAMVDWPPPADAPAPAAPVTDLADVAGLEIDHLGGDEIGIAGAGGSPAAANASAAAPAPAPPAWNDRRAHAERLFETGDRVAGVRELEQMAAELERAGDLEGALTITDELIRLTPDSVRHHQKRVEFAFRASDRGKLIDAYIELGDALFRSGEEQKARAVYHRVLELAPDHARARAALASVASMSPPAGSGAIAARHDAVASPPRTVPFPLEPTPSPASNRAAANGVGSAGNASQPSRPSPLDPSPADGDFVDLGDWLRADEEPKSTRMVAEEKPPTGDEQADFQEMLKRFKQGVADNVDDEDYESHYDLGVAYKEMGLMDEAVAEFQKALRGTAHRVRAYEALGQCFVEKEQYQVASSVLARAMALGEGDDHHLVGVLYLLGRATEALNKQHDALDYYQRVFAVDIEFRDVAERISAIERKAT